MEKRDYYEVLGVERGAESGVIKSAYRKKARELHPDANNGDKQMEERFKEAAEAYEVLSDPQKRDLYDKYGHAGPRQAGFEGFAGAGVEDILSHFADFFGGDVFGSGGGGGRRSRGADIQTRVELTFLEAMKGCKKDITFDRQVACEPCRGTGAKNGTALENCRTCAGRGQVVQAMGFMRIASPCPTCHGQGRSIKERCDECKGGGIVRKRETLTLDVPPGIDDERTMRVSGRGMQSGGGGAGNLYIEFHVEKDPRFERDGDDLYTEVGITFAQAALGCEVSVPLVEGEHAMKFAAGTQPGTVHTLHGRGAPRLERGGHGDLHARVRVDVPRKLTAEQRALVEQLAALDAGGSTGAAPHAPASDESEGGFFWKRKKKKGK